MIIDNAKVTYGKCAEKGKNGDYYVFMLGDAYNLKLVEVENIGE